MAGFSLESLERKNLRLLGAAALKSDDLSSGDGVVHNAFFCIKVRQWKCVSEKAKVVQMLQAANFAYLGGVVVVTVTVFALQASEKCKLQMTSLTTCA